MQYRTETYGFNRYFNGEDNDYYKKMKESPLSYKDFKYKHETVSAEIPEKRRLLSMENLRSSKQKTNLNSSLLIRDAYSSTLDYKNSKAYIEAMKALQEKIKNYEQECELLKKEKNAVILDKSDEFNKLKKESEKERAIFEKLEGKLKTKLMFLEKENNELKGNIDNFVKEIARVQESNDYFKKKLNEELELNSNEKSELKKKNNEKDSEILSIKRELDAKNKECEFYKDKADGLEKENKKMRYEFENKVREEKEKVEEFEKELDNCVSEKERLEEDLRIMKESYEREKENGFEMENSVKDKQKHIEQLIEKNSLLEQRISLVEHRDTVESKKKKNYNNEKRSFNGKEVENVVKTKTNTNMEFLTNTSSVHSEDFLSKLQSRKFETNFDYEQQQENYVGDLRNILKNSSKNCNVINEENSEFERTKGFNQLKKSKYTELVENILQLEKELALLNEKYEALSNNIKKFKDPSLIERMKPKLHKLINEIEEKTNKLNRLKKQEENLLYT